MTMASLASIDRPSTASGGRLIYRFAAYNQMGENWERSSR